MSETSIAPVPGLQPAAAPPSLDVTSLLAGKRFVVFGGTGFLGKVWLALVLDKYPDIEHMHVVVRSRPGKSSEQRFWEQIAGSEVFKISRDRHGENFEAYLRQKVTPIDGDVSRDAGGVSPAIIESLRGRVDAVVNVSGVVDFSPPLDEALDVNAFGVQNLVELARRIGPVPVLHTSTCYVAGNRTGQVLEVDPRDFPFPRADELDRAHWSPEREISECMDLVRQARQRADDAFRQSMFADEAKRNLRSRNEPASGPAYEDEERKVRRRFVEKRLVEAGTERAKFWGWPNIYTYTKAIGEQILAESGLPFTIVRPAIIESSLEYPFPGWNEGINTSAPLIYGSIQGLVQVPSGRWTRLDIVPVDLVANGMVLALAALLQSTARPVYQLGTSDENGVPMKRIIEMTGLYKRKHYQQKGGNPLVNFLQAHIESVPVSPEQFYRHGSPAIGEAAQGLSKLLRRLAAGPAAPVLAPAAKAVQQYGRQATRAGELIEVFLPFVTNDYIFSCANVRELYARTTEDDRARVPWRPDAIDWRHYWMEVHIPGLEKWVFPQIEEKQKKPLAALRRHETLVALLDDMADRHDLLPALCRLETEGISRISFREWRERSDAVAARLSSVGVGAGDRVVLSAKNHPDWPITYFGILKAGAAVVPVDPGMEVEPFCNIVRTSGAKVAIWDAEVDGRAGATLRARFDALEVFDLHEAAAKAGGLVPPKVEVRPSDVASLIFTSGTTGTPKGVVLTHGNFTSLLSALAPVFPLSTNDRTLSVLPLHHTFEFTCGMLLPLAAGARIIYLDELNGERLAKGLQDGRVTAMVGVPALWQLLERRILSQASEKGPAAEKYLEWGAALNRVAADKLGLDLGKVLFAPIHGALGGNIRYLVSGGAALPEQTQKFFNGLGLHLAEGYGLTEAAPVLTVQQASPRAKPGSVGKAVPNVELRLKDPDSNGVGEVLARGPNVMQGYLDNPEATAQVLDEEGWLHTGDLGRFDRKGRLQIVGRAKDVIVSASGENVYPDDVENTLGRITGIEEFAIVGIDDPRGGERVAMLARPESGDENEDRSARQERARKALRKAIEKLPMNARPAVVHLYEAELPKTATRKVKRSEVRKILARMIDAADAIAGPPAEGATPVRAAVAALARRKVSEITANTRFQADLGFDSLMMMELVTALEQQLGGRALSDEVAKVETVGEAERLVGGTQASEIRALPPKKAEEPIRVPEPVQKAVKSLLGRGQMSFYEKAMETRVTGRAYIPHNRNAIVVANHASHLDMGLVKYALGAYGQDIVALAAQDYFFEDRLKRAFFENFTNLAALDRKGGVTKSLKQAGEILERGKTVLIFPEGTRSPDGQLREFKRAFVHLALAHRVDVLPMYLRGTYEALPRGGVLPTRRKISAHIGPPLEVDELERLTKGMKTSEQVRRIAEITRRAVETLKDGSVLDLRQLQPAQVAELDARPHPLVSLFKELEGRFQQGAVDSPVSFYFTLGVEPEAKWTCVVDGERCSIIMGRPPGGTADCVLKTSQDIFTRIVREAYVPGVDEFVSGAVKSNDIGLLGTFQKVFALS